MTEKEHDELLAEIVRHELAMFLATPNAEGPAESQQHPEAYQFMRLMSHASHEEDFLKAYLEDLRRAEEENRNFTIEKYALLNNEIKPFNENPLIDKIAEAETEYLNEASELYPDIIKGTGSDRFREYLRSELQSLSDKSLELYKKELEKYEEEGRNPAIIRHNWLARKLGKPGLEE